MSPAVTAEPSKVSYITTDTIKPATLTEPPTPRLELTPWDLELIAVHPIQKGLLFRQKPGEEDTRWITQLKTSLSSTLDHFYPLAGRLATEPHADDNTFSVFIQCNNAGAEFVHAKADLTVSDVVDAVYVPRFVHEFFPRNGMVNYDGRFQSLLAVQVTELLDGFFIGCTMNHTVGDGATFWHFMNTWSEMCKTGPSQEILAASPNFNRWFLKKTDLPIRFPTSTIDKAIRRYDTLPSLEERIFHFAPQNIAKLKAIANHEIKKNSNAKTMISSLQAVLGHVWQAAARGKNLDTDQSIHYMLIIGNRGSRLDDPPLPEGYFGNSFHKGLTTATAGELNQGLGVAGGLLNGLVSSYNNAKICSAWESWVKKPVISCLDEVACNILVTGSSPRFNMYGNDFGWGCPIAVRSGWATKFDGSMTVYPGVVKGSIDVEACLSPKSLRSMGEDLEFMEFVGVVGGEN